MNRQNKLNRWTVLWSAIGIGVILGILYVWSVISKGLMNELGWSSTQASLPYTVFTVCMSLGFFVSGQVQDKLGPWCAQVEPQTAAPTEIEVSTRDMLRTRNFYLLFAAFTISAVSGLMVIAHAAKIAQVQVGWKGGFLLVIVLNFFNTAGRFLGGSLSYSHCVRKGNYTSPK